MRKQSNREKKGRLIIFGASGHGKVVADIALLNGYRDIIFIDSDEKKKECAGFPVISDESLLHNESGDKIVAIGNPSIRERIQKDIETITLIHPNATIGRNVKIGQGTVVMAGAVINSDATIGNGCIINTSSSVDHDCIIGNYAHVSVGAHICGTVKIGKGTWIGAGATVINNVNICDDCTIGAGAVVTKDIEEKGTYVGLPAKILIRRN